MDLSKLRENILNTRVALWLSPFVGPVVGAALLLGAQFLGLHQVIDIRPAVFGVAAALNMVLVLPLLFALRAFRCKATVAFLFVAAGVSILPTLFLSAPLFSFEPLPEQGFYLFPFILFFSLATVTGAIFGITVRRENQFDAKADD